MWQNTVAATDSAETTSDLIALNVTNGKMSGSYNHNNDSFTNQSSNEIAIQATTYPCEFGLTDFRKRKIDTNEMGSGDNRSKRGRGRGSRGSYKPRGRGRLVGNAAISNSYGMHYNQVPRVCVNPEILKILGKTNSNSSDSYNSIISSQSHNNDYFLYDINSPSTNSHQMEIQQNGFEYNHLPSNYITFEHSQDSAFRPFDAQYCSQNFQYEPEYQMQINESSFGNNEDERVYHQYYQKDSHMYSGNNCAFGHVSNGYYFPNNASYAYANPINSDHRSFLDISNPQMHHLINDASQQESCNQLPEFDCNSKNSAHCQESSQYIDEVNNFFSNYSDEDSVNYYINPNMANSGNNSLPPVSTVLLEKDSEDKPQDKEQDFFVDGIEEVNVTQNEDVNAEQAQQPEQNELNLAENTSEISSN